jgi:3-oxoacyl-[acyl-carrier-protein] synthase III
VKIEHISYSLGRDRRSIVDWCERHSTPEPLRERMQSAGLVHYHDHGERDVGEMALAAVAALIDEQRLSITDIDTDIDLVVYFHTQQTSLADGGRDFGAVLAEALGLRCPAFALSQQNCVSALVAMQFIDGLFEARPELRRVLLVGADAMGIDRMRSVNGGVGFHSDGAVAATLVREGRHDRWLGAEFLSFAEHYRGMQSPPELAVTLDRQYFLATHKVITGALRKAGVRASELRWLLPHNVNAPGWRAIASGLQIDPARVYTKNIADKSHLYGGDGLVNLADICSAKQLQEGEPYLVFSMGYGGFFGAAVLQH